LRLTLWQVPSYLLITQHRLIIHKISTRGSHPNTKFLSSLGGEIFTPTGGVKVENTLQLSGHPDILALGDIIEWPEQKQAAKVKGQAEIVVANVLSVLERKQPKSVYKGSTEMIVITNGQVCVSRI
jgi:NADH dehydrogenase FAD-containing subunit